PNQPPPAPFKESVRCAEQNLYVRAKELVGDRDPRAHEFSVQMRAFDASKSGTAADKGAKLILLPVATRKQLVELDDDVATRVTIVFYSDARDALLKALLE